MGCCFRKKKPDGLASGDAHELGQDQPLIDGKRSPSNGNKNKKVNKAGRPIAEPNMFHKPSRRRTFTDCCML